MIKEKILMGLEIECESPIYFSKGFYHDGISISKYWFSESDGSLYTDVFNYCYEFVSQPFKLKELKEILKDFKALFETADEKKELCEVLNFNKTMGAHIHFSFDDININNRVFFEHLKKLRYLFYKKIRNSNIDSKESILIHYRRSYAKLTHKKDMFKIDDRYKEFNFSSLMEGKGFEWRSPNMLGIKKWSEFFEFYSIIEDCLIEFYKWLKNIEIIQKVKIDIKKILEDINTQIKNSRKKNLLRFRISDTDKKEEVLRCVI